MRKVENINISWQAAAVIVCLLFGTVTGAGLLADVASDPYRRGSAFVRLILGGILANFALFALLAIRSHLRKTPAERRREALKGIALGGGAAIGGLAVAILLIATMGDSVRIVCVAPGGLFMVGIVHVARSMIRDERQTAAGQSILMDVRPATLPPRPVRRTQR